MLNTWPSEETETDDFVLEFIDSDGRNLGQQAVPLYIAGEYGYAAKAIHAVVPLPGQDITRIRLLHEGRPIAERDLEVSASEFNQVELSVHEETHTLHGMDPSIPFLIAFNDVDHGTRETLALDVTGGEWSINTSSLPTSKGLFEIVISDRIGSKQLIWRPQ